MRMVSTKDSLYGPLPHSFAYKYVDWPALLVWTSCSMWLP